MKETIYTIPVNEVYETDCECPLCELEKKLEKDAIDFSLGGAMMEPDFRLLSNEKGYCINHYRMMFKTPSKLQMALVLDTHLMEIRKTLSEFESLPQLNETDKKGFLKKGNVGDAVQKISKSIEKTQTSCVICDKICGQTTRCLRKSLKAQRACA